MRINPVYVIMTILLLAQSCSDSPTEQGKNLYISQPVRVIVRAIPASAEIVYHQDGFIYVMDQDGGNVTQIAFEHPRNYEHVAVSYDRKCAGANEQLPNPSGIAGGNSRVWLFDLENGTEAQLVPNFLTAGNGGVDWDRNGFIYFSAKE